MSARLPIRSYAPDPWADIDEENEAMCERYASGEFDRERARQWARISAMLAELPDRQVDEAAARERADEAMGGLVADFNMIVAGHKQFNRQNGRVR